MTMLLLFRAILTASEFKCLGHEHHRNYGFRWVKSPDRLGPASPSASHLVHFVSVCLFFVSRLPVHSRDYYKRSILFPLSCF